MKSEPEIRAEIVRLRQFIADRPHAKSDIEKYSAVMRVQTLAWVLGETGAPSVRVKI